MGVDLTGRNWNCQRFPWDFFATEEIAGKGAAERVKNGDVL
jgi:hypothetical protein